MPPTRKDDSKKTASANSDASKSGGSTPSDYADFLREIQEPPPVIVVDLGSSLEVARGEMSRLKKLQSISGKDAVPVFDVRSQTRATVATMHQKAGSQGPGFDTARFFEIDVDDIQAASDLVSEIRKEMADDDIEVLPAPTAVPALGPALPASRSHTLPQPPDFFLYQGYMGAGPQGLGFAGAWGLAGGDGAGVTIIDVEGGWRTGHVELAQSRFSLWAGTNSEASSWLEHGAAVVALLSATHNGQGTASVCPGARVGMASVFQKNGGKQRIANSIAAAGDLLNPGDVLLLELQRPGPRTSYSADPDQKGYVPLTFWPDVRVIVRDLVTRGITVVSVGGNGGENLDDEIYNNRFDRDKNDSGCIMVGAGAPPDGTFGPPRTRLEFSNYGNIFDVQAWGENVVSAGYGDLWGGNSAPDQRYTSGFMGTSSAAPLIAGLVACIQGRHKAVYGVPVNPLYLRGLFRQLGWGPDTDEPDKKPSIGLQPDLAQLFSALDLI